MLKSKLMKKIGKMKLASVGMAAAVGLTLFTVPFLALAGESGENVSPTEIVSISDKAAFQINESTASGSCGSNVTWIFDGEDTLTVNGSGAMENYSDSAECPWYSSKNSIKSVVIGSGVTSVGSYAFDGCSALSDVYYSGSESDWNAVTVNANNDPIEGAVMHYNSCPGGGEHSFTNYVSNNDATCIKDGTKTAKCDYCDATDTVTDKGSKKGHSYRDYVSDNNATCTEDGTKSLRCTVCGGEGMAIDEGSALGHSFTNYVSDNNATCTEDGTKTAICDRCDATDTIPDEGSALGHDYSEGTCKRCGEVDLGYTPSSDKAVEQEQSKSRLGIWWLWALIAFVVAFTLVVVIRTIVKKLKGDKAKSEQQAQK